MQQQQQQHHRHHHMYTISDIIRATTCVQRILFRKTFEELRDRPGSFYWKHVVIENSPWNDDDIIKMPASFLEKYPTDFKIRYNEKGCNIIKCYHDIYCDDENNIFLQINKNIQTSSKSTPIYACGGACTGIYVEFFEYLLTRYDLRKKKEDEDKDDGKKLIISQPLVYFDTLNIIDKNEIAKTDLSPSCYCGVELTGLKTLALRPSSRWTPKNGDDDDDDDADDGGGVQKINKKYLEEHVRHYPAKWKTAAGLVDSPPLTWNAETQNVHFNIPYCERFRKQYDREVDTCYETGDRKVLNFLLGKHVASQFSFNQWKSIALLNLNNPEIYQEIQQRMSSSSTIDMKHSVEQVPVPVPQTPPMRPVYINLLKTTYNFDTVAKHSVEDNNILTLLTDFAVTTIAMEAANKIPALVAYLLRYFSERILRDLIRDVTYLSTEKLYTRLLVIVVQSGLVKFGVDMAIKFLARLSIIGSALSIVTLISLPLEILAGMYNWGGYNNEITRSVLDDERRGLQTLLMKDYAHMPHIEFLSINTEGGGDFVTPNITPEMVYYVALSAFLKQFPDLEEELRKKALQESFLMVEKEYLSQLTHNSLGQRINDGINDDIIDEEEEEEENREKKARKEKELTDTFRKAREYIVRQALSYTVRDTIQFSTVLFSVILGIVLLMLGLITDVSTYKKLGSFILVMSCAGMAHWSMTSEYLREI